MKIKTYPIQFTSVRLSEIAIIAKDQGKSIKQFILEAIDEKMKIEEVNK